MLVSASFLGWPFAIFKMVVAAVTGLIGGWITDATERPVNDPLPLAETDGNTDAKRRRSWVDGWNHGIEIVRSIWIWLVVGVLLSAIIESWIPTDWIQSISGLGLFAAMLVMLVVSLPLYVCATASVPIAAALVISGLPPAAALVFLMAGPATNITTIGAIHARFGTKTTGIYLATIIIGSMAFAYVFDWLLTAQVAGNSHHDHSQIRWWETGSSGLLLLMLSVFAFDE